MSDIKLSPDQDSAVDSFLEFLVDPTEKLMILEGPPGSGKSFLAKHLVDTAKSHKNLVNYLTDSNQELRVAATALTHKAAAVLDKSLGIDATSIHTYLGISVFNDFKTGDTKLKKTKNFEVKENTLLLIDEISMANEEMVNMIESATMNCKVLLIGDEWQLLSVKAKYAEAFKRGYRTASLTTIQRQQPIMVDGNEVENPIKHLGVMCRETVQTGQFFDLLDHVDNVAVFHLEGPDLQEKVTHAATTRSDPDDFKIVAWSNDKAIAYNNFLRNQLTTSESPERGELLVSNSSVKSLISGDIVIKNNELVEIHKATDDTYLGLAGWKVLTSSGDTVFLAKCPKAYKAALSAARKQGKTGAGWMDFFNLKDSVADLRSTYAATVHKTQGSTYGDVYIDLYDIGRCNQWQDVARLLTVAITRAANRVYFYGQLPEKYINNKF